MFTTTNFKLNWIDLADWDQKQNDMQYVCVYMPKSFMYTLNFHASQGEFSVRAEYINLTWNRQLSAKIEWLKMAKLMVDKMHFCIPIEICKMHYG